MASDQEDIAQLKLEVARLTRLVDELYYRSGTAVPSDAVSIDDPPADVIDAVRSGQQILAIKLWRERTGVSLAEAKNAMDALAARFGL